MPERTEINDPATIAGQQVLVGGVDGADRLCLEPLGLSVTAAAEGLGISRKTLSSIINGRAGISPEMAIRLSIAFDTSAESWLNQQSQFDPWQAERNRDSLHVHRLSVA